MPLFHHCTSISVRKALPLIPIGALATNPTSRDRVLSLPRGFCDAERFALYAEACHDIESLRKLHACVLTGGLSDRTYLASKLLNCYATIGDLSESRFVVDRIASRDISLWNSAIIGQFRAGQFEEVLWLYSNMRLRRIGVDSSSVTFCLKSCVELGDVEFGQGVHVDAYKFGFNAGKFVGSSLVGLYSRCGDVEDAHKSFEEVLDKDVVAYTSMITGYVRSSDFNAHRAFGIGRDMLREGLDMNRVTLVSLLQAAGQLEALKEGRSIHCYALRRGNSLSDEVLETSLVDMYSRCGAATEAVSVSMQSGRTTVASWNAMIGGLVHCGRSSEAIKCFYLMQQEANVSPDLVTLANVLTACSDLRSACQATTIHAYLFRREVPLDLIAATVLIDTYSQCGKTKYASKVFDQLVLKDKVSYNVMIYGHIQNGKIDEAIKIYDDMVRLGVRPNSSTMSGLLSIFSELSDIRRGRSVHGLVLRHGLQSDVNVANQILLVYTKCGRIDLAERIFSSIVHKDVASWTTMMMGYIDTGCADKALRFFHLMQETRILPDSLALITVLQAITQLECPELVKEIHGYIYRIWLTRDIDTCSSLIITYAKCGMLDSAKAVFDSMVKHGLNSWNTMVSAYGIHGCYREMLEVFRQMQRENVKPDEVTFTSLLSCCSHAGLVEEGWRIFCSMKSEYNVDPKEEHYGCMVDLFGRAGQLEKACDLVQSSLLVIRTDVLRALVAACRVHGNTNLGEAIGRQLIDMEPQNPGTYALVSNLYAQSNKWFDYANIRDLARKRGLRKVPGCSRI